jgi:hypothetical protein
MQTQCLLEGDDDTRLDVRVRFLHVVQRIVSRRMGEGFEPVAELTVGGERHLSWEEASEREVGAAGVALGEPQRLEIAIPAGRTEEALLDADGAQAGTLVRTWRALSGTVTVESEALKERVHRLTVTIANTTPWSQGSREDALEQTFASTHTILRLEGGLFVSLADPPEELRGLAEACENVGTWPVPVGEEGERHTLLSSPIILEDYPRIAPESPGDLFDGGEIDELLTLNILSLTEDEKQEMRDSDPRTREILARTESLTPEQMISLHGAMREFRMTRRS